MRLGLCAGRVRYEWVGYCVAPTRWAGTPAGQPARCRRYTSAVGALRSSLRAAADFCPPPADADEEETPVVKEFGFFAFEGVADELENPSDQKKTESVGPQAMQEDAGQEDADGQENQRNA
jgi:hypothetical protein